MTNEHGDQIERLQEWIVVHAGPRANRGGAGGARLHDWEAPPGCGSALLKPVSAVRVVPIESECRDGAILHGLDEHTGQEAWSLEPRPFIPGGSGYPVRPTDGGIALVTAGSGGYVVVDAANGKELGRFDSAAGFPTPEADGRVPTNSRAHLIGMG